MEDDNNNNFHNDELCLKLCNKVGDVMYKDYLFLGNEVVDISGMSKEEIKKMVDNCKRKVKYNGRMMWFDYQALFEKTRNKILGKTDNIKVKYANLKKNSAARHGIFNYSKPDMNLLFKALDGDLESQKKIMKNIYDYYWSIDEIFDKDHEICYSRKAGLVHRNYLYLLTIRIALCEFEFDLYNYYFSDAWKDFLPTYFCPDSLKNKNNKLIENMNFYAISRPVMGSMFFDKDFY